MKIFPIGLYLLPTSIQLKANRIGDVISDFKWAYQTRFCQQGLQLDCKLRFIFRSAFYLRGSAKWFRFLRTSSLRCITEAEPSFLERIHRPFFDHRLPSIQRTSMLVSHYEYLYTALDECLVNSVMQGKKWLLGTIVGKSGCNYDVVFNRVSKFEKEGCLCLQFVQDNSALLTLSISFITREGAFQIKIGGVQGETNSRDALRFATRDLYGIQPRLLLIEAVRDISHVLGFERIVAIDNRHHVYRSLRYRRKKEIKVNYDALWLLSGGVRQLNGIYNIPVSREIIEEEDRPMRKRAEYRRRSLVFNSLQEQIRAHLLQT